MPLVAAALVRGDGTTAPEKGDYVYATYTGVFAAGTEHGGKDYSGSQFDSTWDSKLKKHKPRSTSSTSAARRSAGGTRRSRR